MKDTSAANCNPESAETGENKVQAVSVVFPLANGNLFEFRLRDRVAAGEVEKLKQLLDLAEDAIVDPDK